MTRGAIYQVLGFILLMSGLSLAQGTTTIACGACLPDAPSAVHEAYLIPAAAAPVPAAIALSPSERPFHPVSQHDKFHQFLRRTYSPYTLFNGMYDATLGQAGGDHHEYGGGMEGWGKRLGCAMAGAETRNFFGAFFFPTLLKQDTRYFPQYHGSVWKRMWHATSRVVITRGDNGSQQFNASGLLAVAASGAVENVWLPANERGWNNYLNRSLAGIQAQATTYLLREFTPDLVRFFKKHAPKSLVRIEEKIPERFISGTPEGEQ